MKKRFYSVSNLLLSSLITMLGLGACKTASKVESEDNGGKLIKAKVLKPNSHKKFKTVYGPPPVFYDDQVERQRQEAEALRLKQEADAEAEKRRLEEEKKREEMKVVYGPPVSLKWEEVRPDAEGIYDVAQNMPQFPEFGGNPENWIAANLRYPEKAKKEGTEGRVVVNFIVRPDGTIDGAMVTRHAHPLLDAEALRLVKSMPKWRPGRHLGENVAVRYTLPITFKLK